MAVDDATQGVDPVTKRSKHWPAFLAGFLLGGGIAVGVCLALWNRPALLDAIVGGRGESLEVSHRPTEEEVSDYLDDKTLSLPTNDVNVKPKTITINRTNVSDVKWSHGSRLGGDEEPWIHSYSCLYADESGAYILDLRIPVRVVGSRRVFLPIASSKVTPVEKVVTPTK